MTLIDDYLGKVRGAMTGMDSRVREDILRELRSHLADATAANGGDVARALAEMGPPSEVGRRYRDLYGYSRAFQALFVAFAGFLGILSSAVLQGTENAYVPNLLSLPALVALVAWLLWVSVRAGSRVGLLAGFAAFVARLGIVGLLTRLPPGAMVTPEGLVTLLLSSGLLLLVGWLPGTAKKAWTPAGAQL